MIIAVPFVRISGESALRFDIPSLRLYFFGSVFWINEAYFFLLALLLFFIGIMLFTVLYGRIWCGWMCPQTVLSDFFHAVSNVAERLAGHPALRAVLSQTFAFLFSLFIAATLIWYFVSPYRMLHDAASGTLGPWTAGAWILFTLVIYLDLILIRQRFCGVVCPYARLQSAFFDQGTLTIAFDTSRAAECGQCEACVRDCPAGIDIRKGLQIECINCAQCIDACGRSMAHKGKKSLIGYFFGLQEGDKAEENGHGLKRPRVLGLSIVLALIAVLFVYEIALRVPADFTVLGGEVKPYGFKGVLMNSYDLFVENRSLDPGEYRLTVEGAKDVVLLIGENPFVVVEDSILRQKIYVLINRKNLSDRVTQLRFILESTKSPEIRIIRTAPFLYPERTDQGVEI